MRRLSMRVPLRLRLAPLRRLWLRRLWLLLVMGTLPHLLKGTLPFDPMCNKDPSQHCVAGRGPTVLVCPPNGGNWFSSQCLTQVNSIQLNSPTDAAPRQCYVRTVRVGLV